MFFDNLPKGGFVCAHRGARSIAPENTLLAMRRAKECGAHCWETDIRLSKDDGLIIFHDPTLERTTDVAARPFSHRSPWPINQCTTDELHELDAGSWFLSSDPFGTIASGEVSPQEQESICGQHIPLLSEVLEYTQTHHFPVNLEIKGMETPPGDVHIVDKVMDMLCSTASTDLVLLSSFRHEYLYRARELHPTIALAVLAEDHHPPDLRKQLHDLTAAYHPDAALCDPQLISELQKDRIRITPWTVNDMSLAQKMLRAGIGVITDWPQLLTGKHRIYPG